MVRISKKHNMFLLIISFVTNAVFFLLDFAFLGSVFATIDDYRMSLIVSGAYTGEPSDTLVFMKYPIAWLLSSLYKITSAVPWYGIATMLCIFIPASLICYFILRETLKGGYLKIGIAMYLLFYLFIVQKHVVLPQFTLTAAFMSITWVVFLWYMPKAGKTPFYLVCTSIFSAIAFSIRMKVFMMIAPVAVLVVAANLIKDKLSDKKYLLKYIVSIFLTVVLCLSAQISDNIHTDASYSAFNKVRSELYDFGKIPSYVANKKFYDSVGIDETVFYDLSSRYLDLDSDITTERIRAVAAYSKEQKKGLPIPTRIASAAMDAPSFFLQSEVLNQAIFTAVLLIITVFIRFRRKKYLSLTFILCTAVGMVLEMAYLCFISRVMDRLVEVMLLTMSVTCIFVLTNSLYKNKTEKKREIYLFTYRAVSAVCAFVLIIALVITNQRAVIRRSEGQHLINSRLEVINEIAAIDKEVFYCLDAYDFIAASSDVFSVYDGLINTDSLGNWYINSPDYFKRNAQYGITDIIDGLIDPNKNIYYAAIGNLKNGIVLTMKERYNLEPVIVRSVPYKNNNIYIYTFVSCS